MGCQTTSCIKKQHVKPNQNKVIKPSTVQIQSNDSKYGIKVVSVTQLQFHHAPLYKNQALHKKFNSINQTPEQVNIPCMIASVKLGEEGLGGIRAKVIHQNSAQLWVICGGREKVSITGLTIAIENIQWCGKIELNGCSSREGEWHLAKPKCDISSIASVTIVLAQVSSKNSIFILHEYTTEGYKIRQKLQWNSLSFNLGQVYRNSLNNGQADKQYCVSCLTEAAQCIFIPCRHMCLCSQCSIEHKKVSAKCPLCRKDYTQIIQYRQNPNSSRQE